MAEIAIPIMALGGLYIAANSKKKRARIRTKYGKL